MSTKKPNFLIILADDLGFSDIQPFGSEIHTPNLQKLAEEGSKLLSHHTASACSPTRAMTLSGTDAHIAGLGVMIELKKAMPQFKGRPGYEGFLNKKVAALPEILSDNGYHTLMSGKWHLGLRPEYGPQARGFDRSFSLLPGTCNHYGWEPQLEGDFADYESTHTNHVLHTLDGTHFPVTPNLKEEPGKFYSSDTYTDKLLEFFDARTEEEREKPFFTYLTYTAPHWPIQAPRHVREKYYHLYHDGPAALRKQRLKRLVELGLVSADTVPHEIVDLPGVSEWDTLTPEERALSARCLAAYAGMIEEMDRNIGRVLDYLRASGEYDNTFVLFMSDNGAEGAAFEAIPVFGTQFVRAVQTYYDNSLENIGNHDSFTWIGPHWAQASTAPARLFKTFPSEGGILVPAIVKGPAGAFRDAPIVRSFTTCMDIVPTLLDLAGIKIETNAAGERLHRGAVVHPIRGKSWVPHLGAGSASDLSANSAIYSADATIGWELFARAALRKGDYKIVHFETAFGGGGVGYNRDGWELFNIVTDPGETRNLAKEEPEKLRELLQGWDEYVREAHVVWGDEAAKSVPISKEEDPLLYDSYFEQQRTWMHLPKGGVPSF